MLVAGAVVVVWLGVAPLTDDLAVVARLLVRCSVAAVVYGGLMIANPTIRREILQFAPDRFRRTDA